MEEERPEYAEAIQVGKRRSSLGALSKSKPVTKLKSMFEAKGPVPPKPKDIGLLGKLKPVSASHDASAFSAAVASFSRDISQTISFPAPADQLPATPTQPLFNLLQHPPEPEVVPAVSPPPSVEDVRTSPIQFNEALHDGGEADTKSVKSPGSAGFLKRMGSSIKKALTPKSSSGKHKAGSPRYAGSDASNLSPQPSGQLFPTPSSQPSSTSLDLNCRSDQMQPAQVRSPTAGFEVQSAHEEQDWCNERSRETSMEVPFSHVIATHGPLQASPHRSPAHSRGGAADGPGIPPRLDFSPHDIKSVDVALSVSSDTSVEQMRVEQLDPMAAGAPMAAEDSFVSADTNPAGGSSGAPSSPVDGDEALAASLTTSPTVNEGSERSQTSPPMREVNMGADVPASPPPFNLSADNGYGESDMAGCNPPEELVFPSLTAPAATGPFSGASSPQAHVAAGSNPDPADVEMAAPEALPANTEPATAGPNITACAAPPVGGDDNGTQPAAAVMDVDMAEMAVPKAVEASVEPSVNPIQPVGRRSFGAAIGALDLSGAVVAPDCSGSPRSPDATTPTNFGNDAAGSCIIGLTPVRPETAAVQPHRPQASKAALSTVAEGSPEAVSASPSTETHEDVVMVVEEQQGMDIELAAEQALPSPAEIAGEGTAGDTSSGGDELNAATSGDQTAVSLPSPAVPSSASCVGEGSESAAQPATAEDMDWDGDGALPAPAALATTPLAAALTELQEKTTGRSSVQDGGSAAADPTIAATAAGTAAEQAMDSVLPAPAVADSRASVEPSPSEVALGFGTASTEPQGVTLDMEPAPLAEQLPQDGSCTPGDVSDPCCHEGPRSPPPELTAPATPSDRAQATPEATAAGSDAETAKDGTDGPSPQPNAEVAKLEAAPAAEGAAEAATPTGGQPSSADVQEVLVHEVQEVKGPEAEPAIAAAAVTPEGEEPPSSEPMPAAEAVVTADHDHIQAASAASSLPDGTAAATGGGIEMDIDMADADAHDETAPTGSAAPSDSSAAESESVLTTPPAAVDTEPVYNSAMPVVDPTEEAAGMQQEEEQQPPSQLEAALSQSMGGSAAEQGPSAAAEPTRVPQAVAAPVPGAAAQLSFVLGEACLEATVPSCEAFQSVEDAAISLAAATKAPCEPACTLPDGDTILGHRRDDMRPFANVTGSATTSAVEPEPAEEPAVEEPVAAAAVAQEASTTAAAAVHGCCVEQEPDQQQPAACQDTASDLMEVDSSEAAVTSEPPPLASDSAATEAQQCRPEEPVRPEVPGPEDEALDQNAAAPDCASRPADVEVASEDATVPPFESQHAAAAACAEAEQQRQLEEDTMAITSSSMPAAVGVEGAMPPAQPPQQQQQQSMEHDYDLVAFGSAPSDLPYLDAALAATTTTVEPDAEEAKAKQSADPSPSCQDASVDRSEPAVAGMSEAALADAEAPQVNSAMPLSPLAPPPPQAAVVIADDPMMVSPMPQRLCLRPPSPPAMTDQAAPPASPSANAPASAHSAGTPGMPTPISPETAHVGVRAFQLDDVEESEAAAELRATTAAPEQDQAMEETALHDGRDAAAVQEDDASTSIDAKAAVVESTADRSATVENATETGCVPASGDGAGAAACAAPPQEVPTGAATAVQAVDVPMADSLEAIEALWGNDDLLGEGAEDAGSLASPLPMPQAASSPISASKQAANLDNVGSARKVAPDVVLQVQRESLDLFSLRNSCAGRVSDSLMVESLDSFEGAGICGKSRAIGFVPMAPVNEASEQEAEEEAGSPVGFGSYGGAEVTVAAAPPVSQPSPTVIFAAVPRGSPMSEGIPTPGLQPASASTVGTPSANRPAAASNTARGILQTPASGGQSKAAPPSALKTAITPATASAAARANAAPTTALKALAAASAGGSSAGKPSALKRSTPPAPPHAKQLATPGPLANGAPAGAPPTSGRTVGFSTPGAGAARPTATAAKSFMPSPFMGTTPGAGVRTGLTPRGAVVLPPSALATGAGRAGALVQPQAGTGRPGGPGLFDTPVILRAAAVPLADSPFPGCDFDLDTVDISAEASRAIAMLGAGEAADPAAAPAATTTHQVTPVLAAAVRVAATAATPTLSVMETHVQLLTTKLAETEALLHKTQEENAMLRDQLSTLHFESSMTNDLDMEREARQFLEQELAVVRHRSDGMEAELRTNAEQVAALKAKEAEMALRLQQMESELTAKSMSEQAAEARAAEVEAKCLAALAEARSAAATATSKCDEATARAAEMQGTLGLQAHQLVQVQRARDEAEAKFQKAMEQLIATQTAHKKQVVEYESKLQQQNTIMAQFVELRERYKQMKQYVTETDQRVQRAETKAQETATALQTAQVEKAELMRMCNELLTQLEASKAKGGR